MDQFTQRLPEWVTSSDPRVCATDGSVYVRRRILLIAMALLAAIAVGFGWVISAPRPAFADADAGVLDRGDAVRGKRVFDAGQCASCHASPGQRNRLRLGGGMALASPFGTFFPPNISPDAEDGIGRWRGVDLGNALMAGVSPRGQHYYPALPYPTYSHMRPEDVADLMTYLRTLPAVAGRAPPHELPFPFGIRRLVPRHSDFDCLADGSETAPAGRRGRLQPVKITVTRY